MTRNPAWTRDELILALDLYFRAGRRQLDATNPEVIELSKLLNRLPIHNLDLRQSDFRNVQGVSMKLGNFSALDPAYEGAGLVRGGKGDKEVWDEFSEDIGRLSMLASSIVKSVSPLREVPSENYSVEPTDDDEEFPEGKILTRLHKYKERKSKAARKKKRIVLQSTGKLACEACGFDFLEFYGTIGYGFAECHHLLPIANLEPGHRTRLEDLAIVCANCHRILHKSNLTLSIIQLRETITQQKAIVRPTKARSRPLKA